MDIYISPASLEHKVISLDPDTAQSVRDLLFDLQHLLVPPQDSASTRETNRLTEQARRAKGEP